MNDLKLMKLSSYNSPIWVISKKPDSQGNKRWRICGDRFPCIKRKNDRRYLPNITEILDQLGSAKYFSVFDLASGFH